jgi:DNA-binding transcriptional regulator YhcF (GntR family)
MEHLANEHIIITKIGIGNFVNNEYTQTLRDELAAKLTHDYIRNMHSCGLSSQEILNQIEQIIKEDTP